MILSYMSIKTEKIKCESKLKFWNYCEPNVWGGNVKNFKNPKEIKTRKKFFLLKENKKKIKIQKYGKTQFHIETNKKL